MSATIFHSEWTPERKAMFVDFRLRGMHTHWAVFWAMADRVATKAQTRRNLYTTEEVEELWVGADPFHRRVWSLPMAPETNDAIPEELLKDLEDDPHQDE